MKKFIVSLIAIIMLISCVSFVNAAEVSATLTPSSTKVKRGETFTLKITAECSDGINSFSTSIQYDKDVFELVNKAIPESSSEKWSMQGSAKENEIYIICDSRDKITEDELCVVTFKVKDDAEIGQSIISAGTITIDSDAESDSMNTIDGGEFIIVNVTEGGTLPIGQATLKEIKIEEEPTKTIYSVGEKFSPAGMVVKAIYSDGTEKEIEDYTYSPIGDLSTLSTKITISYTENGVTKTATQKITIKAEQGKDGEEEKKNNTVNNNTNNTTKKDNTVTNNSIADTGLEDNMGILFVIAIVIAISSYIQYRKYKNF